MKYCKECKFVKRNWAHAIISFGFGNDQWLYAKCSHIKSVITPNQTDALLAKEILTQAPTIMYCSTMRLSHLCGEEAIYFEEKYDIHPDDDGVV